MDPISCDIVILPSPDLQQRLINLSRALGPKGTRFALDGQNFFPHASLYMTQLKTSDIEEAGKRLAAVAQLFAPFDLTAASYEQAEGYIDADYNKAPELTALQEAVLAAINPIRDGIRPKDAARMATAGGERLRNYEKYGWASIGSLFRPHATITRFTAENPIDTSDLPPFGDLSGRFVSLGLMEMGDNGTCVRKIASFDFKQL